MYRKGRLRIYGLSLFMVVFLCMLVSITHIIASYAGASDTYPNGQAIVAKQENGQNSDQHPQNAGKANPLLLQAVTKFEPLLLLILGTILFSAATAIKIVLSGREEPKSKQTL